jgi:hypothetical protein
MLSKMIGNSKIPTPQYKIRQDKHIPDRTQTLLNSMVSNVNKIVALEVIKQGLGKVLLAFRMFTVPQEHTAFIFGLKSKLCFLLVGCMFGLLFNLKLEAVCSPETSVKFHQSILWHIQ